MEDLKNDIETGQEEQVENHWESNNHNDGDTTTSSSASVLSNDSIITIDSPEADDELAETSDTCSSVSSRNLGFRGRQALFRDNYDPEARMEEGRAGTTSPLEELGAAELIARQLLNYRDVILESVEESDWSARSTGVGGAQKQTAYLFPQVLNGKFFSVDENSLKLLVGGTYQFGALLGAGSYSWVLEGVNLHSGQAVAVKISTGTDEANEHMDNEIAVLRRIGGVGFPSCIWSGAQGQQKIFIMEKFGPSLTRLLVPCNGTFTLKTTLMLADQCVTKLQKLHGFGFVHSDIKPDNVVMGVGELCCNQVFLIDYGLAKGADRSNNYAGDILYASLNVHRGGRLGPMDDMESLGYTLLYLQMGQLPWSNLVTLGLENNELYRQIYEMKRQMSLGNLKEYPSWFMKYMRFCVWNVTSPDYQKIRRLFQEEMNQNRFAFDCQFDWVLFKYVNQYAAHRQ